MKIFLNALFFVTLVCALGGFTLVSVGNAAISTFDTDLDGWTSNTPAEIEWAPTGGNPNGYVQFNDATGNTTYI